jgi:hypothetical protein
MRLRRKDITKDVNQGDQVASMMLKNYTGLAHTA